MLVSIATRSLHAQQKDPQLATVLSFILPGGGQFYAERPNKANGILITSIAGTVIAPLVYVKSPCRRERPGHECASYRGMQIGPTLGVASWLYGLVTAEDDARAFNDLNRPATARKPCVDLDFAQTDGEDMQVRIYEPHPEGGCKEYSCKFKRGGVTMSRGTAIKKCREESMMPGKP